jgi:hypothetical protein
MRFSLLASSRSSTAFLAPNIKAKSPLRVRKERLRQLLSHKPLRCSSAITRSDAAQSSMPSSASCRWRASSPSAPMPPIRPAIVAGGSTSSVRTARSSWLSGGPIPRALVHDSGRSCSRITTPNGRLVYAGRAGTGMAVAELERVWRRLRPLVIDRMPLSAPPPRNSRFGSPLVLSRIHWVCPQNGQLRRMDPGWLTPARSLFG